LVARFGAGYDTTRRSFGSRVKQRAIVILGE
jgi:hypothetical protein